jgi:hypothetical protein
MFPVTIQYSMALAAFKQGNGGLGSLERLPTARIVAGLQDFHYQFAPLFVPRFAICAQIARGYARSSTGIAYF